MTVATLEKVNIIPADSYEWWRNALNGVFGTTHAEEPQPGFYRSRRQDKQTGAVTFKAVAYWYKEDGTLRCQFDGKDVDENMAREAWPYVSRRPITHELFKAVREGAAWPDLNEVVAKNNAAPADDSLEAIQERIDDLTREAERLMKAGGATDQATADQASDVANTLGELQNKAIALHKVEKQPHLDAGRAVDTKWFGLRDRAEDVKKRLKAIVVTPWLTKRAKEAEAAKVAAIQTGTPLEQVAEVRATAGSSKRSTGLRTYFSAEIVDRAALLESLKDHPELNALLQKIADGAASKKIAMPGCKIKEEKRAA